MQDKNKVVFNKHGSLDLCQFQGININPVDEIINQAVWILFHRQKKQIMKIFKFLVVVI